jgi:drug/metabolite transporter (DMT)-like permease
VLLAITAGALTAGCGYALWYWRLPTLSATQAATVQLPVPVLAAAGAVAWLGETLELSFLTISLAILGEVALAQGAPKTARP